MRIIYFFFLGTLLWSYWKALTRLAGERVSLTPILGWMAGLGYFLVVPLALLVLNNGYTIPSFYSSHSSYASVDLARGTYFLPMLVIWLALLISFQAILLLTPRPTPEEARRELLINEQKLKRVLLITFGLAMVDHVATIWMAGGLESFLVAHWYLRQEETLARFGDAYVLYMRMSLANSIVFTAAAALYTARELQRRKIEWRFSSFIVLALLLQLMMSGNRIFIALYGLSFLMSCWIYRRKKPILVLLVLSPAILSLFSAWAYFRHNLTSITEDIPTYMEADLGNRPMTTLMDTTEGASVMQLLHMINDFGGKFDYFYGLSYSKAVTFVLPRRLYPSKPQNFPVLIARLYEPGEDTSLGTTQLGELYANFGVLSVLVLPFVTVLILLLSDKLAQRIERRALLSAVLFLLLIWFARSSFEDNFITFLFAWILIWGLRMEQSLCFSSDPRRASPLEPSWRRGPYRPAVGGNTR